MVLAGVIEVAQVFGHHQKYLDFGEIALHGFGSLVVGLYIYNCHLEYCTTNSTFSLYIPSQINVALNPLPSNEVSSVFLRRNVGSEGLPLNSPKISSGACRMWSFDYFESISKMSSLRIQKGFMNKNFNGCSALMRHEGNVDAEITKSNSKVGKAWIVKAASLLAIAK
ncbi:hypothetical protein K7X08_031574 [Anisodus acutangulus]|uniref:Uncharacterized protein n=1 Tax=Anisodus acutangulus TaxID=402998 RepID=A0A9Q1MRY0_9SOLA|nr:hypothetical protein K7X08_031574 [Anisodus acutangulus]